jgi:L-ascorbate metabolism protein UlaG (beta-lactamase superfamily)
MFGTVQPARCLGGLELNDRAAVRIRYLGGPTALLELGGLRILTDPTFDPPGEYPIGERVLTKTQGPALRPDELGRIDVVLLSHDQHPDNLDRLGRDLVAAVPTVFSTAAAAKRLGEPVRALGNWQRVELKRPDGSMLHVTGVPALHGPEGSEPLVGEVIGFVVSGPRLPRVYVSGDNASLAVVRQIAERLGPFEVALLFAGGAQTAVVAPAFLTLTSELAAEAALILGEPQVVPLHFEGWTHYTQQADTLRHAFGAAGLSSRLHLLDPGEWIEL